MIKRLKIILFLFTVSLIGVGAFCFLNGWKEDLTQASLNSEEQNLVILNPNSQPQVGDNWTVSFETKGTADLTITPDDQVSIDDLDFISLKCGREERTPQILDNDVIFYPNWFCNEIGEIIHLVNAARPHTLKFQFRDETAYAYNSPDSVTDYFDTTNPNNNPEYYIASKENLVISGGQVKLSEVPWACGDPITDSRDGKTYDTVLIGSQCWLAKNMNIGTRINGGIDQGTSCSSINKYCYDNNEANCTSEGALYQWNQTMCGSTIPGDQGICPDGWHIPTDAQWHTLEDGLATGTCDPNRTFAWDCDPAGTKLKVGGSSGFEGILAGYWSGGSLTFGTRGTYALFWSSSQDVDLKVWYRALTSDVEAGSHTKVYRRPQAKTYGFSVRCLKD